MSYKQNRQEKTTQETSRYHGTIRIWQFPGLPLRYRKGLRPAAGELICLGSGDRLWRYTACEISVADPGAVPGASTNLPPADAAIYGGELGSTRVVKVRS